MHNMSWQAKLWTYTVCIFFTSASYTMCIPFLPVYLLELGAPESSIEVWSALVFSACFLIAGVMAPVWGKISDTHGKKSMAMRSSILLALCYTLGGLVTAPIQLLGVRILQGFANGYLPVIMSIGRHRQWPVNWRFLGAYLWLSCFVYYRRLLFDLSGTHHLFSAGHQEGRRCSEIRPAHQHHRRP